MNKSTPRIHHNGGTKAQSPQLKIRRKRVEHPGARPGGSIAVLLFDTAKDKTVSPGIDLTGPEFAAIQRDAAARGETLDVWLIRTFNETPALRNARGEIDGPAEPPFGWGEELESARQQSHALHELLALAARNLEGDLGDDIRCGISELIDATDARLSKAIDGLSRKVANLNRAAAKEVAS